ncbi:hypothetical protein FQR65_LT19186 [Abscondita terminalis]|nr:hypothetical protein FQR65_LT19186 [Abscondita terminalis]
MALPHEQLHPDQDKYKQRVLSNVKVIMLQNLQVCVVGWAKSKKIEIQPQGYAMFGYGMWSHRAYVKRTALFARSFSQVFSAPVLDSEQPLLFCCLDLGCITYAMREGVVKALTEKLNEQFNPQRLVLMATHTHSGPGGCAYEALYNMPTPGFGSLHVKLPVSNAALSSILKQFQSEQETENFLSNLSISSRYTSRMNRSLDALIEIQRTGWEKKYIELRLNPPCPKT